MVRISPLPVALLAVAVLLAGAIAGLHTTASAQDPAARTLTFTELERGATFKHVRNTKGASERSNLAGDQIVFTNPLADASGARAGRIWVGCVTTGGARDFMKSTLTCTGVITLADGTLALHGNASPNARTTTVAVTGGTGAYANARGVYVSEPASGGSSTTITLAG